MRSLIQALATLHYPEESIKPKLLSLFHPMDVLETQTILKAGEVPDKLFLIYEGLAHVYHRRNADAGRLRSTKVETTRLVAGPNEWLTIPDAFIDQVYAEEYIDLMGGSKVFYLYYSDFTNLCETDRTFRQATCRLWATMLRKAFEREDILKIFHPLETRIDLLLEKYPHIERYLPNRSLASLAGVSESTLKRYLAKRKA